MTYCCFVLVTVSFHNFKSQNFKSSVSNPESKHVAYLYVLSQISNCQGLGRKNKFENLKTYRREREREHTCLELICFWGLNKESYVLVVKGER